MIHRARKVLVLGALVLGVAGLAGSSAFAAGEEIVVETTQLTPTNPINWIDYSVAQTQAAWMINSATCLKLLDYAEATGVLQPEAAVAMPTVSADAKTYTFTVRGGQAFAGGPAEPVSAESFKRAIERATSPAMAASISPATPPARPIVSGIVGAPDFFAGTAPSISGVQASGDVLTIQLSSSDLTFKDRIAMPYFCATRADTPAGYTGAAPHSGGPYFVMSASAAGSPPNGPFQHTIVLRRNTAYTGSRLQNLGTIRFVQQGSAEVEDYVAAAPAGYTAPAGYSVLSNVTTGVQLFALNTSPSRATFGGVTNRRAAAYALNRTALSGVLGWQATDQFISPLLPGWADSNVYPLSGNTATAASILDGATPAVTLCHPGGARGQVAVDAETQLEAAGFQVTLIGPSQMGMQYFTYIANPANCDMALFNLGPSFPDQSQILRALFYGGSPSNYSFFNDPAYNARFDTAAAMTDESARLAEYRQLDAELADQAVAIAIGYNTRLDAFADRIGCRVYSQVLFGFAVNRLCISVEESAAPGGTVSTGGDATPEAPLQTSVTVPSGGTVTITQGQSDASELPAFKLLDQQIDIEAPAQTPPAFLTLTFEFDADTLDDADLTVDQVVVYRNGVGVASPCTTAGATPDPCVVGPRTTDGQGDGVIVVRTSQASSWNFGGFIVKGPVPAG